MSVWYSSILLNYYRRARIEEDKARKLTVLHKKRSYWESRMTEVMSEIEQFKLDEYILQQAEEHYNGNSNSEMILTPEELNQLRVHHATTNLVALNSKLAAVVSELDTVHIGLDELNVQDTERVEDLYLLPPAPGSRQFQVNSTARRYFKRIADFLHTIYNIYYTDHI